MLTAFLVPVAIIIGTKLGLAAYRDWRRTQYERMGWEMGDW